MKRKLKTRTLGPSSGPVLSILKGRHTKTEFKRAFKNEGWDSTDIEIEYEWLRETKKGFSKSSVSDLKAEIYTVSYW